MKIRKRFKGITACMLVLLLAIPFTVLSGQIQVSAAEDSERIFKPQELEQMLAPIALYPDALLAQVLTAATYPLEVVEAARFVKKNPGLKGDALLKAAKGKDWEPSVKAMLGFPDVLAMMDEQLEWTKKLGDAFIVQQQDCMETVQRLRQKAYARGNLTTTAQQVIVVDPQTQIIVIKPADAKIVYLPVYDPTIIYGAWWYPAYPPYYFYPRRYFGIRFFSGIFVGVYWGTWGCNWHNHHVHVNINHYKVFTRNYYRRGDHHWFYKAQGAYQPWRYNTRHRQISRYRSSLAVKPRPTKVREYKQVTVRQQVTNTQATNTKLKARPVVKSSTQSRKIQVDLKKVSAPTSKRLLTYRARTKSPETAELKRNRIEKRKAKIATRSLKSQKLKKSSSVKSDEKSGIGKQISKRQSAKSAKGLSRSKVKSFIAEDIGKSSHEQRHPRHQVPASIRGSSGLPEGLITSFKR
jgi:hypothetical protein